MRPEDETPDVPPADDADEAADAPAPKPATWAGRQRAEDAEPEQPEAEAEDEPAEDEQPEAEAEDEQAEEEDEQGEGEDEEGGDAEADAVADPEQTVEADTLALADRVEAEEAALAGLKARTAEHEQGAKAPEAPVAAEPPATPVMAAAEDGDGKIPRAKPVWARFLAASLVIVISMAAATSISLLVYLTDIADGLGDNDALASLQDQLELVDGGDPQTILILGSDKRLDTKGDPGRSDTTILLRVDPDKDAIALLSIPRDLRVTIPRLGVDKFNAAYSAGGPDLTLEVVKRLTGLEINHVVNINFTGFADAVNAIGCVYIDVDRRYYIPPESGISEINLEAGYQRLCGYNALQYVRYRHDDNDLVRSARQQDFLREARQKLSVGTLIRDNEELLDIFTEYTTSDISDGVTLLELMKTFLAVQSAPVREVHFPAELGDGTTGYVTATDEALEKAIDQFLVTAGTPGARPGGESPDRAEEEEKPEAGDDGKQGDDKDKPEQDFVGPPMDDSTEQGQTYANQFSRKKRKNGEPMVEFPILYPTRLVPGSIVGNDSRAFVIDGGDKEAYYGYKFVVGVPGQEFGNGLLNEYYGVSGTNWTDAPILDNPSETRTIDGRDYQLFYDGDRLRLVGFETKDAVYWVNNSLSQSLEEGQMLSIATSMQDLAD